MNRQKFVFIIIATLVAILGVIVLGSTFIIPEPKTPPLPKSTPSATKLHPFMMVDIGSPPSSDLTKLPNFKSKTSLDQNTIQYSFTSPLQGRDDLVVTKNDKVIFERAITLEPGLKHPKLSEYKQRFGQPEAEIEGSKFYGNFEKTYIYASKGFALIANPFTEEIDEIHTFTHQSVESYISTWGDDILSNQQTEEEFGR